MRHTGLRRTQLLGATSRLASLLLLCPAPLMAQQPQVSLAPLILTLPISVRSSTCPSNHSATVQASVAVSRASSFMNPQIRFRLC